MKVVSKKIPISKLEQNIGQIDGLPANPRKWSEDEVDRLAASLLETPELFEARPIIVYPYGDKFVILGGNLRYQASLKNKVKTVPCVVASADWDVQKLGEIVLKDNGVFGDWDYPSLSEEWGDVSLADMGIILPESEDYSGKNKEIDPSSLEEKCILKLRYNEPQASMVREALGDDPRETLLMALGYGDEED